MLSGSAAAWCEDRTLLCGMFDFDDFPCSQLHSETHIRGLRNVFTRFIESMQQEVGGSKDQDSTQTVQPAWLGLERESVSALKLAAEFVDSTNVTWYPEFGCALLALCSADAKHSLPRMDVVSLHLLCLDSWRYRLHSTLSDMQPTATCEGHVLEGCGSIASDLYGPLLKTIRILQAQSQKKRKDGEKGLQHTPAFMLTVIADALRGCVGSESDKRTFARGGYSDVGQHTGSIHRDTCWPLLRETIKAVMTRTSVCGQISLPTMYLFETAMANFDLWLLQRQTHLTTPRTATAVMVNAGMKMLASAAAKGASLAAKGYDIAGFETACHNARQHLSSAAAQRALAIAQGLQLPALRELSSNIPYTRITGLIPASITPCLNSGGLAAAQLRSLANLGSLPVIPADASFSSMLATLQLPVWTEPTITRDVAMQLSLSSIEHALFSRAAAGFKPTLLTCDEMKSLESLVDHYRYVLLSFLSFSESQALMQVELHSRELLVAWIAFCVMHSASSKEHPLLRKYGVSLRYADLRHLVLSDKAAVDAALSVGAYLQTQSQAGPEVFSLRDTGDATFRLALEFAEADRGMTAVWQAEMAAAEGRTQGHWREVLRKQQLAATLRSELHGLQLALFNEQSALVRATEDFNSAYQCRHSHRYGSVRSAVSSCQFAISTLQQKVTSVEAALKKAEESPLPVIQPLPQNSKLALPWIFFLHMPASLRHLSRMSFVAQQMLLPHPCSPVSATIAVKPFPTFLTSLYNAKQQSEYYTDVQGPRVGLDGSVLLCSRGVAAEEVGPKKVDDCYSSSDGVWHPDSLLPEMGWCGCGTEADLALGFPPYFNPFAAVDERLVELAFTEQLSNGTVLQWALHQNCSRASTPADRSNLAIAQQDVRPDWLSKPGYLTLCNLRSYPLGQLRQLCTALHERNLPLGHPVIHVFLKQLLYHIGILTGGPPPALLWRTGWSHKGDVLETLCAELSQLTSQLDQTPREHDAVPLLGEIAAYLSDWHAPCRALARRFAAMTSRVADDLEAQIAAAPRDESITALQARQCLWRMRSLLCIGGSGITAQDAEQMVRLIVLINHGQVFLDDVTPDMGNMLVCCHHMMSNRICTLIRIIEDNTGILTTAVSQVLQRAPLLLTWSRVSSYSNAAVSRQASCSYEAVGGDGNLYSINLLDGTVLLNGLPPGRLPRDIITRHLYTRSFGDRNFEVAVNMDGVLQTVKPVGDCFYDFFLSVAGELVIKEVDKQRGFELQLLDVGEDGMCGSWGAQLPVRLRELHSHWLCREKQGIVLRPHLFSSHAAHFIIKYDTQAAAGAAAKAKSHVAASLQPTQYICIRVPAHLHNKHWADLMSAHSAELTHELVLHTSHIKTVLAKLEVSKFIHTYVPLSATTTSMRQSMLFELPRYSLEFQLQQGQLVSLDYSGYRLSQNQQLATSQGTNTCDSVNSQAFYTLPGFQQYLMLQRIPGRSVIVGARRAESLVIVAMGKVAGNVDVSSHSGASVKVEVESSSKAYLKVHCYEVHGRFGHLRASDILPRLQLAALYAATGTLLPEPHSCLTGAQTAMQLVRQCWKNSPLTPSESTQLSSVADLGGYLAPALRLLVHELFLSSSQLNHLHAVHFPLPDLHPDARTSYRQLVEGSVHTFPNLRMLLTPGEEQRVLGTMHSVDPDPDWLRLTHYSPVKVGLSPVVSTVTAAIENTLNSCVVMSNPVPASAASAYPLLIPSTEVQQPAKRARLMLMLRPASACTEAPAGCSMTSSSGSSRTLEQEMHAELKDSWDMFHRAPSAKHVVKGTDKFIQKQLASVAQNRAHMESHLLKSISSIPVSVGHHGTRFRLMRASGAVPTAGLLDLVRFAWQPNLLRQFNPFLSAASCNNIREGVLIWLQLCVLEDRLQRLKEMSQGDKACLPMLIQELLVKRTWDVKEHPQWLVFEAEGQIQIRPQQHWIADHLIHNPGAIDQLNMGEGKTRVILPMLVMHWADGSRVVRLNFLNTLMGEAYSHLHNTMCASVLGRKLFTMPFHRDVDITAARAQEMHASINLCQQEGGMMLVAPEQRLSLQLKWHEMWSSNESRVCSALQALAEMQYVDLLDESDELLNHRFQLVYACGTSMTLPGGIERAQAIQALTHIISGKAFNSDNTQGVLSITGVAVWTGINRPGSFSGLRLLPGKLLQSKIPTLHKSLAESLVNDPPYELRWLHNHPSRDNILRCITDESKAAVDILGVGCTLEESQMHHVLALRGLLACNLLQHALQKRHCVDFGVSRSGTARKRLAVPFRAAHTPAERSEYAQPDIALLLTHLAYYYDGLSKPELLSALKKLLGMGANAQAAHYKLWLAASVPGVCADELETIDNVLKIDTSNSLQMELLFHCFSHNMHAVDFWLNHCVFPTETKQFPKRLACNAWHLADNAQGKIVGFSGTNDNHRLLPLQVKQHTVDELSLKATNGKMLAVILNNQIYSTLAMDIKEPYPTPAWQSLLDKAVCEGFDALLDCGALLAGVSNRTAAEYLLPRLEGKRYQGVCFFFEREGWTVLDRLGRCLPRHSSPIAEREAFVIFDDARCRGADLQLRREAIGLLTLGPGICKDKLMQAAGRLRQLGRGQTLHIVGTPDVTAKIISVTGGSQPTSLHVLQWVMHNTVQATLHGIPEWSKQGLHFAGTKDSPERAMLDETLLLKDFYGGERKQFSISEAVGKMADGQVLRCQGRLAKGMQKHVDSIKQCSVLYGSSQLAHSAGAADEECERELEKEEEEEEEVERQIPRVQAESESDWDYTTALTASNPSVLCAATKIMDLKELTGLLKSDSVQSLDWSRTVYCTSNFASTISQRHQPDSLSEYLRPLNWVLLFSDGGALLVSEREADALLELLWASSAGSHVVQSSSETASRHGYALQLVNLCYASAAFDAGTPAQLALSLSVPKASDSSQQLRHGRQAVRLAVHEVVSLQLLNGHASFGSRQLSRLCGMVSGRKEAAQKLVSMRGKQSHFSRSALELACD